MPGISFSHSRIGTLNLRLPPTQIDWDYSLNTQTFTTYAGEVVQILGVTFGKVIFSGRFGKEGAHGKNLVQKDNQLLLVPRSPAEYTNWETNEPYGVGLSQMLEYFKTYFSAASQGRDDRVTKHLHYDQEPIAIVYEDASDVPIDPINSKDQITWKVYPTSFPSFKRSNENFAPEWRLECEVYEDPFPISAEVKEEIFDKFREGVGWLPGGIYSDPLGIHFAGTKKERAAAIKQALEDNKNDIDTIIEYWRELVPAVTPEALEELLIGGASLPNQYNLNGQKKASNKKAAAAKYGGTKAPPGGAGLVGGDASRGLAGVQQGGTSGGNFPGQKPGETDTAYAERMNPAPSGTGSNYGRGSTPVKFSGKIMGPGADDRYDLSYTKRVDSNTFIDANGRDFDSKGLSK